MSRFTPDQVSPITAELRVLLGDLLLTRHVAQPLACCEAEEEGQAALVRMQRFGFHLLGVQQNGRTTGVLSREGSLIGTCGQLAQPLGDDDVIDAEVPLLALLERLEHRHWLFVRHATRIDGFVSRSDLHRGPVRLLLFGLISLFEMLLHDLVVQYYTEPEIERSLTPKRLASARRLHDEREKRGEELHLADCLQIADKRDLLLDVEGLSLKLGFESNNVASRFFSRVEELRDRLVHANELAAGSSWEEVIQTTLQLAGFLSRCSHLPPPHRND